MWQASRQASFAVAKNRPIGGFLPNLATLGGGGCSVMTSSTWQQ